MKKVFLIAGYDKSLHSIALAHQALESGYELTGCLVVNTYSIKRIRHFLKMYGFKTVLNKFRSYILKSGSSSLSNEVKEMSTFVSDKGILYGGLASFCKEKGIPYKAVNSVNELDAVSFAEACGSDIILYAGGGILRKKIISVPKLGVLNAHSGPLPFFRGMNVSEWTLIYGFKPVTTVHFINAGIDTGDILYIEDMPLDDLNDIYECRGRATLHGVLCMLKVLKDIDAYMANAKPQSSGDGKQFFIMHDYMRKIAEKVLINNRGKLKSYAAGARGLLN